MNKYRIRVFFRPNSHSYYKMPSYWLKKYINDYYLIRAYKVEELSL